MYSGANYPNCTEFVGSGNISLSNRTELWTLEAILPMQSVVTLAIYTLLSELWTLAIVFNLIAQSCGLWMGFYQGRA